MLLRGIVSGDINDLHAIDETRLSCPNQADLDHDGKDTPWPRSNGSNARFHPICRCYKKILEKDSGEEKGRWIYAKEIKICL